MQKIRLKQSLTHRLSPQKLQLIKLLQVPSIALKARIEQEITRNPALEDENIALEAPEIYEEATSEEQERWSEDASWHIHGTAIHEKRQAQQQDWLASKALLLPTTTSLYEQLLRQLNFLGLDEVPHKIGIHLIGSIEQDGYIRQDLETIVNDLAVTQYIETNVQEVVGILKKIQRFDPAGICARNLQECLLVQLEKLTPPPNERAAHVLATRILAQCFQEFTKKHYSKITDRLGVHDPALFKEALALIIRLDPKPGRSHVTTRHEVIHPDFIVTKRQEKLHVALTTYTMPTLKTRKSYVIMLNRYNQHKPKDKRSQETISFVKKKLEAAQWFIDAVQQRQHTLLNTMRIIVKLQHDFFMEEAEDKLKPMVLKRVAEEIGMDVSTVARIVSNKAVQTDLGIYPLKFFFTESITTTSGEAVSNRAIKKVIAEIIQDEDKRRPYSDEKIGELLKARGYPIARRTVAKYREQLRLPVARLRKGV